MRTDALRKFDVDPRSLSGTARATVAVGGGGGTGGDAATVGGYPASAFLSPSYLVVGWDPNLTNERVLLAGNGLSSLDGGANGHYRLAVQLATNPGLTVDSAGLAVLLATNPGLSVGAAGLAVKLATNSGLAVDANGLYVPASFAGAGVTLTNGVLNVGAGAGITVNADDVALTTPGTLSWSTTNSSIGSHTHAMTAYSDASVYPQHLLKSDASGDVKLHMLVASDRVRTAIVDSPIGTSLSLQPAQDVLLSPGDTKRVKATTGVRLQSDGYVSQTTGWAIGFNGAADFRYVYTDELHAKAFIADLEQSLAGGQIISKSVAPLSRDFTAPAAGATADLWVECFQGFPAAEVFATGDYVMLRQFDRSGGGLSITNCFGTVSAPYFPTPQSDPPEQRWTFTRLSNTVNGQPAAGDMGTGAVVKRGALALDFGVSGNGYHEVNAIDGLMAENSPYNQTVKWATHPWYDRTVTTRTGNLKGIFNVANEFGLYAGTGVTDADQFVRISNQAVEAHNLPVKLYDSSNVAIMLQPAASPYIAMGVPIPTGWLTQTGWWAGKDSGAYKQYLGTVSGGDITAGLKWDGTTLTVKGQIYVTGGDAAKTDLSNVAANTVVDKVNAGATLVQPGRVLISGATTLDAWRYADTTYIDGGDIYTGTVTADKFNAHGANMLGNPGFELGALADWGDGGLGAYVINYAVHTGGYCLISHGTGSNREVAYQHIVVEGGRKYWASVWVQYHSGQGGSAGVLLAWRDASDAVISYSNLYATGAGWYLRFGGVVTAPSNARRVTFYLCIRSDMASGNVTFDDAEFYAVDGQMLVGSAGGARVEINQNGVEGYSDSTTKQFYLRTSDGRAMFGGGNATLDSTGMKLDGDVSSFTDYNSVRWLANPLDNSSIETGRLSAGVLSAGEASVHLISNTNRDYATGEIRLYTYGNGTTYDGESLLWCTAGDRSGYATLSAVTGYSSDEASCNLSASSNLCSVGLFAKSSYSIATLTAIDNAQSYKAQWELVAKAGVDSSAANLYINSTKVVAVSSQGLFEYAGIISTSGHLKYGTGIACLRGSKYIARGATQTIYSSLGSGVYLLVAACVDDLNFYAISWVRVRSGTGTVLATTASQNTTVSFSGADLRLTNTTVDCDVTYTWGLQRFYF